MVHGLVHQHGGFIEVETEVGQGTTFQLYFPALVVAPAASLESPQEAPPGGTETILLVEDNETVRQVGQALLSQLGYAVLAAGDGEEALEAFRRRANEIALVLTDMVMPKMGGLELCVTLNALRPGTKVMLVSGYSEPEEVMELKTEGLVGFVQKPLRLAELAQQVRAALDG
jgi:CheY-like chemotaxis protein